MRNRLGGFSCGGLSFIGLHCLYLLVPHGWLSLEGLLATVDVSTDDMTHSVVSGHANVFHRRQHTDLGGVEQVLVCLEIFGLLVAFA